MVIFHSYVTMLNNQMVDVILKTHRSTIYIHL